MHLSSYLILVPHLAGIAFTTSNSPDEKNTLITGEEPDDSILHAAAPAPKVAYTPAQDEVNANNVVEIRDDAEPRQVAYTDVTYPFAPPEPTTLAKRTGTWKKHPHTKHAHTGTHKHTKHSHTGSHTHTGTRTGLHKHKHHKTSTVEAAAPSPTS